MFKIFSNDSRHGEPAETPQWLRDPLAHPDIAGMDGRALGDLPFGLFRPPHEDSFKPRRTDPLSDPRTDPCASPPRHGR